MSLSMAKFASSYLPMRSISAQKTIGETRPYPNLGSIRLRTTYPIGPSIRAQPFKNRINLANASRLVLTESDMLGSKIALNRVQRCATQMKTALAICAYASGAVAETQTAPQRSFTSNTAPGKEKLPMLDDNDDGGAGFDGGSGYKPYFRGDDSGAGGGSGGGGFSTTGGFPWGDFWFLLFLVLLRFLFTQIIAEGYFHFKYDNGKNKPIQRYV